MIPSEIVTTLYGPNYQDAAPLLFYLGLAAFAQYACYLTVQVLIAQAHTWPLAVFAAAGIVETAIIVGRHDSLHMVATVLVTMRLATLVTLLVGTWATAIAIRRAATRMTTVVFALVHYRNTPAIRQAIARLRALAVPAGWTTDVIVADNSGDAPPDLDAAVVRDGSNRGYLGGAAMAFEHRRASHGMPSWFVIVNPDAEPAAGALTALANTTLAGTWRSSRRRCCLAVTRRRIHL